MKYTLTLTSSSRNSLNIYLRYLEIVFNKWSLKSSVFSLPTTKKKIHLLKSPHVYKKAKEHFEIRTYRKKVTFESPDDIERLKFLLSNKPKSIQLTFSF